MRCIYTLDNIQCKRIVVNGDNKCWQHKKTTTRQNNKTKSKKKQMKGGMIGKYECLLDTNKELKCNGQNEKKYKCIPHTTEAIEKYKIYSCSKANEIRNNKEIYNCINIVNETPGYICNIDMTVERHRRLYDIVNYGTRFELIDQVKKMTTDDLIEVIKYHFDSWGGMGTTIFNEKILFNDGAFKNINYFKMYFSTLEYYISKNKTYNYDSTVFSFINKILDEMQKYYSSLTDEEYIYYYKQMHILDGSLKKDGYKEMHELIFKKIPEYFVIYKLNKPILSEKDATTIVNQVLHIYKKISIPQPDFILYMISIILLKCDKNQMDLKNEQCDVKFKILDHIYNVDILKAYAKSSYPVYKENCNIIKNGNNLTYKFRNTVVFTILKYLLDNDVTEPENPSEYISEINPNKPILAAKILLEGPQNILLDKIQMDKLDKLINSYNNPPNKVKQSILYINLLILDQKNKYYSKSYSQGSSSSQSPKTISISECEKCVDDLIANKLWKYDKKHRLTPEEKTELLKDIRKWAINSHPDKFPQESQEKKDATLLFQKIFNCRDLFKDDKCKTYEV